MWVDQLWCPLANERPAFGAMQPIEILRRDVSLTKNYSHLMPAQVARDDQVGEKLSPDEVLLNHTKKVLPRLVQKLHTRARVRSLVVR